MIGATAFIAAATALVLRYGVSLPAWKGLLLAAILLYASYTDIDRREVDDFIHVMVLITAFVGIDVAFLPSMFIGAVAVFVPQLIITKVFPNHMIGGADIKLSTACAFLLGAEKGMIALITGLIASLVVMPLWNKFHGHEVNAGYPLVPFLSAGVMAAYLL